MCINNDRDCFFLITRINMVSVLKSYTLMAMEPTVKYLLENPLITSIL